MAYYAALELLKAGASAEEVNALFADVPFAAMTINEDETVSVALANGYAVHFKFVEGRISIAIYAITQVFDEAQTAGEVDQL